MAEQQTRPRHLDGIAIAGALRTSRHVFTAARTMRREMTPAEAVLWNRVRGGRIGYHIRRQQPLLGFIADFYCHGARLAIEVDGSVHDNQQDRDANRDACLAEIGIKVIRVSNASVFADVDSVIALIRDAIASRINEIATGND